MSNKESAAEFLRMAGTGEVKAAFEKFVAARFVHHNQYFKGDRASLIEAMEGAHRASPNKSVEVKRVFEDGSTVITHSLVVRKNPAEQDIAVVHIFRFDNGRIVELWDVAQLMLKDSPNENGMF